MTNHGITKADITIGEWLGEADEPYRAAMVGECVLTGPEDAFLSDEDLLAEAWREAKQANITAPSPTFWSDMRLIAEAADQIARATEDAAASWRMLSHQLRKLNQLADDDAEAER